MTVQVAPSTVSVTSAVTSSQSFGFVTVITPVNIQPLSVKPVCRASTV